MSFFIEREGPYDIRKGAVFILPPARPTTQGTNSTPFRCTLICNQLPSSIKSSKSTAELKTNLKHLENIGCAFVLCRVFFLGNFLP